MIDLKRYFFIICLFFNLEYENLHLKITGSLRFLMYIHRRSFPHYYMPYGLVKHMTLLTQIFLVYLGDKFSTGEFVRE